MLHITTSRALNVGLFFPMPQQTIVLCFFSLDTPHYTNGINCFGQLFEYDNQIKTMLHITTSCLLNVGLIFHMPQPTSMLMKSVVLSN